jgi:hypothetical protein
MLDPTLSDLFARHVPDFRQRRNQPIDVLIGL